MAKPGAKEMMKIAMETEAAQVLGTPKATNILKLYQTYPTKL